VPEGVAWTTTQGGYCCWVTLPEDGYFDDLYRTALSRGVAYTPSDVFKVGPEARQHMRLCFGAAKESDIRQAAHTLGEIVKERMGSPATGLRETVSRNAEGRRAVGEGRDSQAPASDAS